MSLDQIEHHLRALGIDLGVETADKAPASLEQLLARFAGARITDPVYYFDPKYKRDVMIGWFLDPAERAETYESISEVLARTLVPIANDGGDNLLLVETGAETGAVYFYEHGKELVDGKPPLYRVSPSLEQFLLSLHREQQ
jgi:hypothetical protein